MSDVLVPNPTRLIGRDFAGFWAAGRIFVSGNPSEAYNPASIEAALLPLGVQVTQPFVYPPTALLILAPFGLLPYWAALLAWTALGAIIFGWAAKPFVPFPTVAAILTPAALLNAWDGQFGLIFGALWLCTFRFGRVVGGTTAALAAIKPHLAVLLLPRLLREPSTLGVAAIVAAALFALTLPLWSYFVPAVFAHSNFVAHAAAQSLFLRMMPGPFQAYHRSWVAQAIFILAVLGIFARYWSTDPFALATASFLVLPYAHNYDMTVASLGCAIGLWRDWSQLSVLKRVILSAGYLAPVLTFIVSYAVPVVLLATLVLQCRASTRPDRDSIVSKGH